MVSQRVGARCLTSCLDPAASPSHRLFRCVQNSLASSAHQSDPCDDRGDQPQWRDEHDGRAKVPGYNLYIMLVVLGCVVGLAAVIGIARAMRARSTFNENRMMRDYLRRIASDSNS